MEIIGFVLMITAIIYDVWLLCEVLFIIFVLGAGLFTNWK